MLLQSSTKLKNFLRFVSETEEKVIWIPKLLIMLLANPYPQAALDALQKDTY